MPELVAYRPQERRCSPTRESCHRTAVVLFGSGALLDALAAQAFLLSSYLYVHSGAELSGLFAAGVILGSCCMAIIGGLLSFVAFCKAGGRLAFFSVAGLSMMVALLSVIEFWIEPDHGIGEIRTMLGSAFFH